LEGCHGSNRSRDNGRQEAGVAEHVLGSRELGLDQCVDLNIELGREAAAEGVNTAPMLVHIPEQSGGRRRRGLPSSSFCSPGWLGPKISVVVR